jgi:hypothetical protein
LKLIQNPGNFILGLLLAAVFVADVCTTQICISTGIGIEGNPIMRTVVENPTVFIFVKGIGLIVVIFLANRLANKNIRYFTLSVAIGMTLGAVINNLSLII